MTGGRVVVLGPTGRNFGAGMSGGVAYVYDVDNRFAGRCNTELVELEPVLDADDDELRGLIAEHAQRTGSLVARNILAQWERGARERFVKVMPRDYKRALEMQAEIAAVAGVGGTQSGKGADTAGTGVGGTLSSTGRATGA
jgi:glutamate synthase domain-containing protein 3